MTATFQLCFMAFAVDVIDRYGPIDRCDPRNEMRRHAVKAKEG